MTVVRRLATAVLALANVILAYQTDD